MRKLGNHKNSINKQSSLTSRTTLMPFTTIPFALASNYINKDNEHPLLDDLINPRDIVFTKEELLESKWLVVQPGSPNPEFEKEVKKIIKYWPLESLWIVIQSEDYIQKENEKEKILTEKISEKRRIDRDHCRFNCADASSIESEVIVAKYYSIKDFDEHHPYYNGELTSRFQKGDEIWHYNSRVIKSPIGIFSEMFLLIRDNAVIYSPLISRECRDDWWKLWRTKEVLSITHD